jgi:hypothetical protein
VGLSKLTWDICIKRGNVPGNTGQMGTLQYTTLYYCIPLEDGLRTETCNGKEKEDCCIDGIIVKLINYTRNRMQLAIVITIPRICLLTTEVLVPATMLLSSLNGSWLQTNSKLLSHTESQVTV